MKYKADQLKKWDISANIDSVWVLGRPETHKFQSLITRIKDAWGVFTGKYDALEWYKQ